MKVIGTAGHIDHGKSTLVERLTGIDPDRLEEEKRRGMTIDLGFAWLTLPRSGPVSIVDVPGHERFVKNMLAGVGGIDAALLVVAADEGVMPQTREHIDILSLLDIRAGVIAITKCDLVDAEWLELVRLDVTDAVAGTSIADLPIVPVSARTGEGLPELVEALDAAAAQAEDRVDGARGYVPVDRVFSAAGFGTVVTGTLHDGSIGVGETWELMPGHRLVRIRSLQVHRQPAQTAGPGARVAVNLAGIDYQEVKRGDVLAYPGSVGETKRFDARLTVLPSAPFSLAQGLPVSLHVGAAERQATLALLDRDELAPGTAGWVQLRTTDELPVVAGQRFIVRLPSPARTVGGGEVVFLDPHHRRSDPAVPALLAQLAGAEPGPRVTAAVEMGVTSAADLSGQLRLPEPAVRAELSRLEVAGFVVQTGDRVWSRQRWTSLASRGADTLSKYHREHPLRSGMPSEELRQRLRVRPQDWGDVLGVLERQGTIRRKGPVVALAAHESSLKSRAADVDRVMGVLAAEPTTPPSGRDLLSAAGVDENLLAALVQEGLVVRVSPGLYLRREVYDRLVNEAIAIIDTRGHVNVAEFRDAAGTSRKYALAFLEHLDAIRVTRRVGDERVRGTRAPTCA